MKEVYKYLIILTFFSCCTNKSESLNEIKSDEEIEAFNAWKQEYKSVTFQRCLYLGYNRSPEIMNLLKIDRSSAQDFPFELNQYRFIDTIVQPIITKAKLDSTTHFNKFLKGMNQIERDELNGLPMMKYCLEYYTSDKLDSISNKRVEQMESLWKTSKQHVRVQNLTNWTNTPFNNTSLQWIQTEKYETK